MIMIRYISLARARALCVVKVFQSNTRQPSQSLQHQTPALQRTSHIDASSRRHPRARHASVNARELDSSRASSRTQTRTHRRRRLAASIARDQARSIGRWVLRASCPRASAKDCCTTRARRRRRNMCGRRDVCGISWRLAWVRRCWVVSR